MQLQGEPTMSSTTTPSTKILWNEQYLKAFASELLLPNNANQFWDENQSNDEVEELKAPLLALFQSYVFV